MAAIGSAAAASKGMKNEDLQELSNIFASEFNSKELHDRVLCFQIIEDTEVPRKDDSDDSDESQSGNENRRATLNSPVRPREKGLRKRSLPVSWSEHESNATASPVKSSRMCTRSLSSSSKGLSKELCSTPKPSEVSTSTPPILRSNSITVLARSVKYGTGKETKENSNSKETIEQNKDEDEQHEVIGKEQKLQCEGEERQETITITEYQHKEVGGSSKDGESKTNENEDKSIVSKLFVHSQLLAVQSPYFKALFYSGMKETYSKEVVMKINEHELEAHETLIEAMYKLDVLSDKDYRLVVQVLVLAHKYDARHVVKKCKYVLLSTTPSLEMCEYILKEITHLPNTADICDMLEQFLVKEFTPFDDTWMLEKFTNLSQAALRLLLRSDNLGIQSENTIYAALMKWVRTNILWFDLKICNLLDLVRFEFMSADFLYDVVREDFEAERMLGFNKYLLKGLAYHGFSSSRREQLEPKPKERLVVKAVGPTFSWVIDDERLLNLRGHKVTVSSDVFCYQGYPMELRLRGLEDPSNCIIYLRVLNLTPEACLFTTFRAKSSLFVSGTVRLEKSPFTSQRSSWGVKGLRRSVKRGDTIDVWVAIV